MSSPLRRGTHESWWTAEQGWFNAVSKVGPGLEPQQDDELTVTDNPYL